MSKREKFTPHDVRDEDHGSVSIDWTLAYDGGVEPAGTQGEIGPQGHEPPPLYFRPLRMTALARPE
jgi:hypothetical protein